MKQVFLIFLILLTVLSLLFVRWIKRLEQTVFVKPKIDAQEKIVYKTVDEKISRGIPFAIVFLGYAGGTHNGAALTDSIVVAYIDSKLKKILLISIPRDLFIKIPSKKKDDFRKINIAYIIGFNDTQFPYKPEEFRRREGGGGKLVEYVLSEVTGLHVDYFISVDFSGFKKTIDTLGGVNINVERTFDDFEYPIKGKEKETCDHTEEEINTYMSTASADPMAKFYEFFPCRYEPLHFDAGVQHMDGETALKYVRSRHSEQDGSDFGRAARQRNLFIAVKDQIFSIGFIPKVIPFLSSLGDDVKTDLTPEDLKSLVVYANDLNSYKVETLALNDDNFLKLDFAEDGQSILIPKEGKGGYTSIQKWIKDAILEKPLPVDPIVLVRNATNIQGLGKTANLRLGAQNIKTIPADTSPIKDLKQTTITVFESNINQLILKEIQKEFSISRTTFSHEKSPGYYNVLVELGSDYANKLR